MRYMLVITAICGWLMISAPPSTLQGAPEEVVALDNRDESRDEPLAPLEAAKSMQLPTGFHATLFAGEPAVKQPIGFCIDDRGRLWVAENYSYPKHTDKPASDQIVILEDTNGDGQYDKRTVFQDKLNYVTGIEVGFGGAWVMSPPYMYFIPDRNGDDVPDAEPQVLLDGFGNHANSHNLANGFAWGPDGWLYCTHGRTNWSLIGKPGDPKEKRTRFDGGVMRYHPTRHVWEPYADGMTNPWGIDWNDYGQAFACNCVDPHLFQIIYGAHYEPWRNRQSSQYAYHRIPTIADHLHFTGGSAVRQGLGTTHEDDAGGGHAHCGAMIYLGDNWPDKYRGTIFMNNIHGKRINNDRLVRAGSGYTATHAADFMKSKDPWFVGVTLQAGPDGSAYVLDWSDTGECHHTKNTRRETGRVFKISYGKPVALPTKPLAEYSDAELVGLQLHKNDWWVRHARRLLQERVAAGKDLSSAKKELFALFEAQTDITRKLRALWALQVIGGLDDAFLIEQLNHSSEYLRGWAVRLLAERGEPSAAVLKRWEELAGQDDSALVRLELASTLQRLKPANRWAIAQVLANRKEDTGDQNIPLMLWYAIEPLIETDPARFVQFAAQARIPLLRNHIARRAAEYDGKAASPAELLHQLVQLLAKSSTPAMQHDLLDGTKQGLAGRRRVEIPTGWREVYPQLQVSSLSTVRELSLELALVFNDPAALLSLRKLAADSTAKADARNRALQALVSRHDLELAPLLLKLIADPATRSSAVRGLAEYEHPDTAATLLAAYDTYPPSIKQDVLQTLASRPTWAATLIVALEEKKIPRADLTAFTARQIQNLGSVDLTVRLTAVWGAIRTTPEDKEKLIADYRRKLTPAMLEKANKSLGRAVFQKTCANCHLLFDTGGKIGPNLTGSQRNNLDYLLENLVDPSASVAKDYQVQIITTDSGRVITGIVLEENASSVTVQSVNEKVVLPLAEIETRKASPLSMMPDGILTPLSQEELRGLFAYLGSAAQVPLK